MKTKVYRKRQAGAKRVYRKKTRMFKSVRDIASCTVVRTLTPSNTNQMYSFDTINLVDYDRASAIAQNYQRFRITGVTVTWKPVYDTYAQGGTFSKANLYYIIDKTGSIPDNVTLESLKQSGARVRALDEKPISVRWRPSVLEENQSSQPLVATFPGPSGYKTSPWLATNQNASNPGVWTANSTNHLGIKFYIEQAGNSTIPIPMDIKVEFQFIKPLLASLSSTPALGLSYAKLDASPDGVEGGSDGITVQLAKTTL